MFSFFCFTSWLFFENRTYRQRPVFIAKRFWCFQSRANPVQAIPSVLPRFVVSSKPFTNISFWFVNTQNNNPNINNCSNHKVICSWVDSEQSETQPKINLGSRPLYVPSSEFVAHSVVSLIFWTHDADTYDRNASSFQPSNVITPINGQLFWI